MFSTMHAVARSLTRTSAIPLQMRGVKTFERYFPPELPVDRSRATQNEIDEFVAGQNPEETTVYRSVEKEQPDVPVRLLLTQRSDGWTLVRSHAMKRNRESFLFDPDYGERGQIVTVDCNKRARDELLLPQLAVYATEANLAKYRDILIPQERWRFSSKSSEELVRSMRRCVVPITLSCYNKWKLEAWHIHVCFRRVNIHVPVSCIEMPSEPISGPDIPRLQNKEFAVFVTVNNHERFPVRCRINHNDAALKRIGWQHCFSEPVLESQRRLLATMPRHMFGLNAYRQRCNSSEVQKYYKWRLQHNADLKDAQTDGSPYPIQFLKTEGATN